MKVSLSRVTSMAREFTRVLFKVPNIKVSLRKISRREKEFTFLRMELNLKGCSKMTFRKVWVGFSIVITMSITGTLRKVLGMGSVSTGLLLEQFIRGNGVRIREMGLG